MNKILFSIIVILTLVVYAVMQNIKVTSSVPNSTSNNTASSNTNGQSSSSTNTPIYKNGTYTGSAADAFYGNIQVQATISGGKITNVQFIQAPSDQGRSVEINQLADPQLVQEAMQSQNSNVDIVSGATDTSNAFIQSLTSALNQAKS